METGTEAILADVTLDDREAMILAATDYIESWLDGDGERMRGCLHPALAKRAVGDPSSAESGLHESPADAMVEGAAAGEGTHHAHGHDVCILDAFHNVASVRVSSNPTWTISTWAASGTAG